MVIMPFFTSLEQDHVEYKVEVEDEVEAGVVWKTGQRERDQQDQQCTELPKLRLRLTLRMRLGVILAGVAWKTGQRDGQQDRQCTELPRLRLRMRMMLRMRMKLGQVEDWAERGPADRQCCELLLSFELPSSEH